MATVRLGSGRAGCCPARPAAAGCGLRPAPRPCAKDPRLQTDARPAVTSTMENSSTMSTVGIQRDLPGSWQRLSHRSPAGDGWWLPLRPLTSSRRLAALPVGAERTTSKVALLADGIDHRNGEALARTGAAGDQADGMRERRTDRLELLFVEGGGAPSDQGVEVFDRLEVRDWTSSVATEQGRPIRSPCG